MTGAGARASGPAWAAPDGWLDRLAADPISALRELGVELAPRHAEAAREVAEQVRHAAGGGHGGATIQVRPGAG